MITSIVRFINIIVAALLAGVSFGIWIGFNPLKLSPSTYIEQQQNMLRALKVLMISLVIFAALITISSAFLQKNNKPAFISLLVAAVFFISCILITRFGIKPIDDKVMTWTVNSIPGDWTELRDKWWLLHKLRTFVELIALFLVTWTSIN